MKKIGLIVNRDKDPKLEYTALLVQCIHELGGVAYLPETVVQRIGLGTPCASEEEVLSCSDGVVCLGGDGTFLKAARKVYNSGLPILGINLGNLGFLTEVDKNAIPHAIGHLLRGEYEVEERLMLDAEIWKKGVKAASEVALNDVVISRGSISRILHVRVHINDVFADMFPGDGLIVASPTGSTAYSLSAGGPIVEPDADLMIVTPICPHILYSRSFITSGNRTVKAIVDEDYQYGAMVTIDGQQGYEIGGGDFVTVRKSPHCVKLVRINPKNFFNVLRAKIYYRGESLRSDEVQQTCKNTRTD